MGFFDFFLKKKPEKIKEVIEEEPQTDLSENKICGYCEQPIYENDKAKKIAKQIFHRKCFKKLKKDATKSAFG